jgi:hypothetical protein
MNTKRKGRFRVTDTLIKDETSNENIKNIMAQMIIVRCEYMFEYASLEYTAISDLFEEVEEGLDTPLYNLIINDKCEIIEAQML